MWQDIVLTICMIAFSYALVPQVIDGFRKKKGTINLQTSLITSLGMLVLTITYTTLDLYFSVIVSSITTVLWFTLLVQKIVYK